MNNTVMLIYFFFSIDMNKKTFFSDVKQERLNRDNEKNIPCKEEVKSDAFVAHKQDFKLKQMLVNGFSYHPVFVLI